MYAIFILDSCISKEIYPSISQLAGFRHQLAILRGHQTHENFHEIFLQLQYQETDNNGDLALVKRQYLNDLKLLAQIQEKCVDGKIRCSHPTLTCQNTPN
jgi:hypothetical protein